MVADPPFDCFFMYQRPFLPAFIYEKWLPGLISCGHVAIMLAVFLSYLALVKFLF